MTTESLKKTKNLITYSGLGNISFILQIRKLTPQRLNDFLKVAHKATMGKGTQILIQLSPTLFLFTGIWWYTRSKAKIGVPTLKAILG